MSTGPGQYDFTIFQGASFFLVVKWVTSDGDPVDISGYDARMQARARKQLLFTLTSDVDGGLIIDGANGSVTIYMTPDQTFLLSKNRALYDLEITNPDNNVTRLLEGIVTISPEVTKNA